MIRPLAVQVTPVTIENGLSAKRDVAVGNFTFPFSAFAPSSAITVVMIGRTGNFEWMVTPTELARMK